MDRYLQGGAPKFSPPCDMYIVHVHQDSEGVHGGNCAKFGTLIDYKIKFISTKWQISMIIVLPRLALNMEQTLME